MEQHKFYVHMEENVKNMIRRIADYSLERRKVSEQISELEDKSKELTGFIEKNVSDPGVTLFIELALCEKLGYDVSPDGLTEFIKSHPAKYEETTSSSISSDCRLIENKTYEKSEDPAYFHPMLDKWKLVSVNTDFSGAEPKYKFTVECLKQRKSIGVNYYEPALYATDWISL